jgi:magnesium-transporting ATPase (P-type)
MAPDEPWNRALAHADAVDQVLLALGTSEQGLEAVETERRLAAFGPNLLPRAPRESALKLLGRQIHNPLIYVLLISAVITLSLGRALDALVVLGVVLVNTLVGFYQELRAGKAINALLLMVPESTTVLRDGARVTILAERLVPGDIVSLEAGDKVPADLRLVAVRGLHAEEASLTGESLPVAKQVEPVAVDSVVGDRRNMLYSGTLIASGTGTAVVVVTGAATELGRISSMLAGAVETTTPLLRSLEKVGRSLTVVISVVAGAITAVALLRGYPLVDALLAGISLAVAAIPEGLPAIITIALSIGVQRMARRRAVIRKLHAVETLGSTRVICSDKTGTLTRNEMTVQALWTPSGRYDVTGVGYAPNGGLYSEDQPLAEAPASVLALLEAGLLCNDAALRHDAGGWVVSGDPTEGALVVAAEKLGQRAAELRARWPRDDAIPFDARHQYMATLHRTPSGGAMIFIKGAPEVVIDRCDRLFDGAPLDRSRVLVEVDRMASRGMRVLAFASREPTVAPEVLHEEQIGRGATLLGLAGMIDPPRPEAIKAIEACRAAGIAVKMVTGDHRGTAAAIAVKLGLISESGPPERVLTGAEIGRLSDDELRVAAARCEVFARVAPEHKLRLVTALQADGSVVAMTGDGVNDAPALKRADIGIAMGITGTAAAKEAADVVLTDDNFASIQAAVEEGRRVYDNLVKALVFILPTNLGLALTILIAAIAFPIIGGRPLMPILPIQILWVNLVTSVALSLPLAFEAPEPNLMLRPPRRPDEPILNGFVAVRTFAVGALMAAGSLALFLGEYLREYEAHVAGGTALRESQTMTVTTLVLFQVFYLMSCRSLHGSILDIGLFSNPLAYVGIGALVVFQLGFVHLPFMNALFETAPLPASEWGKSVLVALSVLPIVGAAKWWQRTAAATAPAKVGTHDSSQKGARENG